MEMDIRVQCTPEALDQGHCTGLCGGFGVAGLADQVCGNGAVDNTQPCNSTSDTNLLSDRVIRNDGFLAIAIDYLKPDAASLGHGPIDQTSNTIRPAFE